MPPAVNKVPSGPGDPEGFGDPGDPKGPGDPRGPRDLGDPGQNLANLVRQQIPGAFNNMREGLVPYSTIIWYTTLTVRQS